MQKKEDIKNRIGRDSFLKGKLNFKNNLLVEGVFEGEINSGDNLVLDEGSKVEASVVVDNFYNHGTFNGNLNIRGETELNAKSKTTGEIRSSSIKIIDGAIFEGKCRMIDNPDKIEVFSQSVEELREALKKEKEKKQHRREESNEKE